MPTNVNKLISLLREELILQGELLSLLQNQHSDILAENANDTLATVAEIQVVFRKLLELREEIKRELGDSSQSSFPLTKTTNSWIPLPSDIPSSFIPLVKALFQENENLSNQIQTQLSSNIQALSKTMSKLQTLLMNLTCERASTPIDANFDPAGKAPPIGPHMEPKP